MADEEEDRRLADDSPPQRGTCQQCTTEFDWSRDTCPNCGWEKDEWTDSGRYGLAKSD